MDFSFCFTILVKYVTVSDKLGLVEFKSEI